MPFQLSLCQNEFSFLKAEFKNLKEEKFPFAILADFIFCIVDIAKWDIVFPAKHKIIVILLRSFWNIRNMAKVIEYSNFLIFSFLPVLAFLILELFLSTHFLI